MPSWNELLQKLESQESNEAKSAWIDQYAEQTLARIGGIRARTEGDGSPVDRNVILYGSAFLQKPQLNHLLPIQTEDLNGFMSVMHGMDCTKPLTLILHTPGGQISGTESIVNYLLAKFNDIEVIVPALAMSAGTMVALAANRIFLGRHSQLGPIDPQIMISNKPVSAQALLAQFSKARDDISRDPTTAPLWAPLLGQIGPAGVVSAQRANKYSKEMVRDWLQLRMLAGRENAETLADSIADYFSQSEDHLDHGKRIGFEDAERQGVEVIRLEDDQALQEEVLTAYHLMTILMEKSPSVRLIWGSNGKRWYKNGPTQIPA